MSHQIIAQDVLARFVNDASSDSQLIKRPDSLRLFSSQKALEKAVSEEISRLQKKGFISAKSSKPAVLNQEGQTIIEIRFSPGNQWQDIVFVCPKSIETYLNKERLNGVLSMAETDSTSQDESRLTTLGPKHSLTKFKISIEEVPDFLNRLSQAIAQNHSPFSQVRFSNIKPIAFPVLSAVLEAQLIPKRILDSLVVKGYDNIGQGLLKHLGGLKFPMAFDQELIKQAEQTLSSSPYVNVERSSETLFEQERTTLYMYLQKKEANQLDGILGFGSNPNDQSLQFNGYLNLKLWNNFDQGEQFDLHYKADGNQQERLEIRGELPYLWTTPFGIQSSFELFRRDSTFTTVTSKGQITYKPFGAIELAAGFSSINSSTGTGVTSNPDNIADFRQSLWGLMAQSEQGRRSVLMPRKFNFKLQTEFGSIKESNSPDPQQSVTSGSKARQRLDLELQYLFRLWQNHYLNLYHRTAWVNGENLRLNELYRFGGTQSLRGFNENIIETAQLHLLQSEYRLSFSEAFYIHHLTDIAWHKSQAQGSLITKYSVGLGIAAVTRPGILKLQIAQGFGEQSNLSANRTKIHLVFQSQF